MPRIFDNIDNALLPELSKVLSVSVRADFCVGYFNLRGWRKIDEHIEGWSGQNGNSCRLLVGMHKSPEKGLREKLATAFHDDGIDNARALELKKELAEEFRAQLALGAPSNDDEAGLRRLARQIRGGKVTVKLFLKHHLHAKLYLLHRSDPINPKVGFVGSSNLTFAGLSLQGELNVDVMDHDACDKLALWFEDRWNDRWCIDISEELATIIEESWAGEKLVEPYHVYLKMRYLRMCPFESGQGHHPPTRAKTAPELGLGSCLSGVKCTERASPRTCEMTAERLSCWPPESRTGFGHRHKHINENRS